MADTHAMADEIRGMGGREFSDPQDVHDTLIGVHDMISALEDVLSRWGDTLEETGVHPMYPEAVKEAAAAMNGIADELEVVTSGGVMRGPGGWHELDQEKVPEVLPRNLGLHVRDVAPVPVRGL